MLGVAVREIGELASSWWPFAAFPEAALAPGAVPLFVPVNSAPLGSVVAGNAWFWREMSVLLRQNDAMHEVLVGGELCEMRGVPSFVLPYWVALS